MIKHSTIINAIAQNKYKKCTLHPSDKFTIKIHRKINGIQSKLIFIYFHFLHYIIENIFY